MIWGMIMGTRPTWDETFMEICHVLAKRSKDKSRQFGCVIVGPNKEIRSTGYNCFPRGTDDSQEWKQERPVKSHWFCHAERNAIFNAARVGVALKGCTLYVNGIPCADCARAIIQSGIKQVIVDNTDMPERMMENYYHSLLLLLESHTPLYMTELPIMEAWEQAQPLLQKIGLKLRK